MGKCRDCFERAWERVKDNSGMIMIVGSILLFVFGCFFLIAGAYIGATYSTPAEQSAVIAAGVAGGLLILFSFFAAVAYRKGHGFFTYFLLVFAGLLFILGLVLISIALNYLLKVQTLSSLPPRFPFSQNITDPSLQSVSDYLNSIYTFCCTGCTAAVCGKDIPTGKSKNGTEFCPDQLTLSNPTCLFVKQCPATPQGDPNCFFAKASDGTTPPVKIGQNLCDFLTAAAWGPESKPVVGNRGGGAAPAGQTSTPSAVSCGGGDPKVFAFSLNDWLFAQYSWISAIVGIILFILFCIMIATYAYDRKWKEDYKPKKTHE